MQMNAGIELVVVAWNPLAGPRVEPVCQRFGFTGVDSNERLVRASILA